MLKQIFRKLLELAGYELISKKAFRVVPKNYVDPKFEALIRHFHHLVRTYELKSIPEIDKTDIIILAALEAVPLGQGLFLIDLIHKCIHLDGDVCEFGVASGCTSKLIAHKLLPTSKVLWLFDSFQGLPEPTEKDQLKDDMFHLGDIKLYKGKLKSPQSEVRGRLEEITFPLHRTHVVPGFIEQTIKGDDLPQTVCFAFVDFDFYEPIKIALQFLKGCMVPGGYIAVHDYDFFSTGAKEACDEFHASNDGDFVRTLPDGLAKQICLFQRL